MAKSVSLKERELLYSNPQLGMKFSLTFEDDVFTMQRLHNEGEAPFPPMAYQARELENGMYIFAFHMPDETYVTLLIDGTNKVLFNSMVWGPGPRKDLDWVWGIEEAVIEKF